MCNGQANCKCHEDLRELNEIFTRTVALPNSQDKLDFLRKIKGGYELIQKRQREVDERDLRHLMSLVSALPDGDEKSNFTAKLEELWVALTGREMDSIESMMTQPPNSVDKSVSSSAPNGKRSVSPEKMHTLQTDYTVSHNRAVIDWGFRNSESMDSRLARISKAIETSKAPIVVEEPDDPEIEFTPPVVQTDFEDRRDRMAREWKLEIPREKFVRRYNTPVDFSQNASEGSAEFLARVKRIQESGFER